MKSFGKDQGNLGTGTYRILHADDPAALLAGELAGELAATFSGTYAVKRYKRTFGEAKDLGAPKALGANELRSHVNDAAAGYRLPNAPASREEAIMAFIKIMRLAEREVSPARSGFFKSLAGAAADRYMSAQAPIWNILQAAVDHTRGVPGAHAAAETVFRASGGAPKVAAKTQERRTGRSMVSAPEEEIEEEMPSWAPWAAGGALVLAALFVLTGRRG